MIGGSLKPILDRTDQTNQQPRLAHAQEGAPGFYHDGRPALVIFAGQARLKWLRILKPGFRHCFVAYWDLGNWIFYEPMFHQTYISVCPGPPDDLSSWYQELGMTVVEWPMVEAPLRPLPWRPFTCVEAVKRFLGVQAPWVLTPWQLYRFLNENNMKKVLDGIDMTDYIPF